MLSHTKSLIIDFPDKVNLEDEIKKMEEAVVQIESLYSQFGILPGGTLQEFKSWIASQRTI